MYVEVKHPLIGHKLTLVRDKTTGVKLFRELIGEITMFLAYEALRGIPTESIEVETPLAVAKGVRVKGEITDRALGLLRHGLELDERKLKPARVTSVEPQRLHLLDFVLARRHDHRHVRRG